MIKEENCVSFLGGRGCKRLKVKTCIGTDCSFYRDAVKEKMEQEKADARLRSLPAEVQQHIADKYYKGKMPWLKRRDGR